MEKQKIKPSKKSLYASVAGVVLVALCLFYAGPGDWTQRNRIKVICSLLGLCLTAGNGPNDNLCFLLIQKMEKRL